MSKTEKTEKNAATTTPPQSDMTKELARFHRRLNSLKHLDFKAFANDYFFPLLGMVAGAVDENDEKIAQLFDLVEESAGAERELLEDSRTMLWRLAALLDKAMVVAGFFQVSEKGMEPTGKLDALGGPGRELLQEYTSIGSDVAEVVSALTESIEDLVDDDEEGDEDEEEAEVGSDGGARASAPPNRGVDVAAGVHEIKVPDVAESLGAGRESEARGEGTSKAPEGAGG